MDSNDSEAESSGKSRTKAMFISSLMLILIAVVLLNRAEEVQEHTLGPAWEGICGGLVMLIGVVLLLQTGFMTGFRALKSLLQKIP